MVNLFAYCKKLNNVSFNFDEEKLIDMRGAFQH